MKEILVCFLTLLSSTESFASNFRWKVSVFDPKTGETRDFIPDKTDLKIPTPGPFSCVIYRTEEGEDSDGVWTHRYLGCSAMNIMSGVQISCRLNKKEGVRRWGSLLPVITTWRGYDKKGKHVVSVNLTCDK
jgi:hypothetical protein